MYETQEMRLNESRPVKKSSISCFRCETCGGIRRNSKKKNPKSVVTFLQFMQEHPNGILQIFVEYPFGHKSAKFSGQARLSDGMLFVDTLPGKPNTPYYRLDDIEGKLVSTRLA